MSKKQAIATKSAPAAIGPYSQAVQAGSHLFLSGQLGMDPATGELREGAEAQADQALKNLSAVLEAAGGSLRDVVKTTVLLASLEDYAVVNAVYAGFFEEPYPARAAFQAARLPKDAAVEIEAIAVLGSG